MQAFADTAVTEQTVSWKEFFSPALLEEIRAYIGRPVGEIGAIGFSASWDSSIFFAKTSGRTLKNLEFSAAALENWGCDYILSGLRVERPEESGLVLMQIFEREDSPYRIYLYGVKPELQA